MRQVKVFVGDKEKTYEINPLKGKHIKELLADKKSGFGEVFQVLDFAGIPDADVDEMNFKDCIKIQNEINAETFGMENEIKN